MIKKTLIFHFFIPNDYETNIAIKLHYACMEKYCYVFDAAEFFITSTEESQKYVINVKEKLLSIFKCRDIRFVEKDNDEFYEARTFKEEVIDRLNELDGLVFFGHTKGTSDIVNYPNEINSVLMWIYGMYFYSLEFMHEVVHKLVKGYLGNLSTMFGPFCQMGLPGHAYYAGTFYWINVKSLINDINNGEIKPIEFASRFYAENFPMGYNFKPYASRMASRMQVFTEFVNLHKCNDDTIRIYGDYDHFIKEYNEIIEKIK